MKGNGRIPGLPAAFLAQACVGSQPEASVGQDGPSIRMVGGRVSKEGERNERILSPGESLDLEITVPHLPAFPPRVFHVIAFQTTGEACRCHRVLLKGPSVDSRARVRILDLPDDVVAENLGPWQVYVLSAGKVMGRATFEVVLDHAWLRRNTRVTGLELRARRRSLAVLSAQTRSVSVRARVFLPSGAGQLGATLLAIEVVRPDGLCAGRAERQVRSEGAVDLALGSLRLARRNEELLSGRWEMRVLIDGVVVASRTVECGTSALFTEEGEIAPTGRELIIAGVPVLQD